MIFYTCSTMLSTYCALGNVCDVRHTPLRWLITGQVGTPWGDQRKYFWVCPWGCLGKKLAFELGCVKQIAFPMWGSSSHLKAWIGQKVEDGGIFLSSPASWIELGHLRPSPVLHWDLQHWIPWLPGLSTWTARSWHIVGLLSLNNCISSSISISTDISR